MKLQVILIFAILILIVGCDRKVEKIYYPDGEIKQEITFKDGIKDGIKDGEFKSYYKSGQLKEKGIYKNNKLEGEYTWYYKNGQIDTKENFEDNKENGKMESYYETGILKSESQVNEGKQDGLTIFYYPDGKIESKQEYEAGIPNGYYTSYHKNGKLSMHALYEKDSVLYYEEYDEQGNFIEEYHRVSIEPLKENFYAGESFKAKIKVYGPIEGREIKIVPYLFGVDKKSGMFENEQEVTYSSLPIEKAGKYYFRVNVFVDTVCYNNELFVEVLPDEEN